MSKTFTEKTSAGLTNRTEKMEMEFALLLVTFPIWYVGNENADKC